MNNLESNRFVAEQMMGWPIYEHGPTPQYPHADIIDSLVTFLSYASIAKVSLI